MNWSTCFSLSLLLHHPHSSDRALNIGWNKGEVSVLVCISWMAVVQRAYGFCSWSLHLR